MRDPKLDPRPGDVFGKGGGTAEIMTADGMSFGWRWAGLPKFAPPMPPVHSDWRPGFRKWAATAEVISRAEDATC